MEVKDIIMGSEDSLPTLQQNLSTATSAGTSTGGLPTVTASPSGFMKFGASTIMGLLGMVLLGYGKKNGDVQKMLIGAALTIGSMFVF